MRGTGSSARDDRPWPPSHERLRVNSDFLGRAIVFVVAGTIAAVVTLLAGRLGRRLGLVDVPGGRRTHTGAVPRIGGLGLFAGFFLSALVLYLTATFRPEHQVPLSGVLTGTAFVALFGL